MANKARSLRAEARTVSVGCFFAVLEVAVFIERSIHATCDEVKSAGNKMQNFFCTAVLQD